MLFAYICRKLLGHKFTKEGSNKQALLNLTQESEIKVVLSETCFLIIIIIILVFSQVTMRFLLKICM